MKKAKKIALPLVLLVLLCSIQISFATVKSENTTHTITTFWTSDVPVPIATEVSFDFTVNKTSSDVVNYQYYYANVPNGNGTAYEQDFNFISTQVLKNGDVEVTTYSSDFESVSYVGDPNDINDCQEYKEDISVSNLDTVKANYMWWSDDCYPSTFFLDAEISF